jgi:hypothetical protein
MMPTLICKAYPSFRLDIGIADQLLLDLRSVRRIDIGAASWLRLLPAPSAASRNLRAEPAWTQEAAMTEVATIQVEARA